MKTRLFAMGCAVCLCGFLAACGGGGGGGSTPPTSPTPTPKPTGTPYAFGDSFAFSGSQTIADTFAYPSPSPYPSTNTTATVNETVTVGASPDPYGPLGAGDFHTIETDTAALVTHTTTTDAWLDTSGSNLLEYGYTTVDDSGDSLAASYTSPAIQDELPETNGATWSNGAGITYNEKDADGTASTRTYAANGTYTESTTTTAGVQSTIGENADGSGNITTNGAYLDGSVNSLAFTAPKNNQVTVTVNFVQPPSPTPAGIGSPTPSPAPTITPRVYTAPAWYGTTTPVLYSQTTKVTIGIAYPASCGVPSGYGSSGNQLVQTTNRLDTIIGYTDAQTQTTYTNPQYGPVCVVLSDVQNAYYDYQDDFATATTFHFHFPGTPLSSSTLSQTLTLQSGAVVQDVGRRTLSHAVASLSAARIAAVAAAFTLRVERRRHQREIQFAHFMLSAGNKELR